MKEPVILAIDTSCDETAVAVSYGRRILSNVIASQINIHKKYGGVVPYLAKRAHQQKIQAVYQEALERATRNAGNVNFGAQSCSPSRQRVSTKIDRCRVSSQIIDAIAVTTGPGLAPALEVGVAFAKNLSQTLNKPLIAINHMEGHLLSSLALNSKGNGPIKTLASSFFPALGLLVSGGHTQLILVKKIGHYQILGETLDDAAGEALDKLAKMLKLGYPGGPIIEELAKKGRPHSIDLPIPLKYSKDLNFSFSGLKTAAMYHIQKTPVTKSYIYNMCASFQQAIADSLTNKLNKAIGQYQPKTILLGGGVISNLYIRRQIHTAVKLFNLPIYLPCSKKLFTDNAAMICIPAYYQYLKKDWIKNLKTLDRQPNLTF